MITISNLEKQYADKLLFQKLNLTIYDGERVGIVGSNGAGKSTLLKIIASEESPDAGSVLIDGTIGFLKQITEYTNEDFLSLMDDTHIINNFLEIKSRLHIDSSIDFSKERLKTLSGGEKTKLMLAGILCKNPEILILDEPTNHLDSTGIKWLIEAIETFAGTVLIVSHDRYFLNNTVFKIVEIENGKVREFAGNYDDYHNQKEMEHKSLISKYEAQQVQEKKINKQINALNAWSNKGEKNARRQGGMLSDSKIKGAETKAQVSATKLASMAKAKVSRLEHLKDDFIDKPYVEGEVYYKLEAQPFNGKVLVRAENLSKSFGEKNLFKNSNFTINSGEKIALLGDNGTGKSTLIKMILGQEAFEGDIYIAPSVKIAYLSQDVFDLNDDETVMQKAMGKGAEYRTRFLTNLISMNMTKQVFNRKISTLSLGERMRIKMCELILSDYNFLIMDEPTNHLDIKNKIFLEKILKEYKGCLLIVSHDHALVENVCNASLLIDSKTIKKREIKENI